MFFVEQKPAVVVSAPETLNKARHVVPSWQPPSTSTPENCIYSSIKQKCKSISNNLLSDECNCIANTKNLKFFPPTVVNASILAALATTCLEFLLECMTQKNNQLLRYGTWKSTSMCSNLNAKTF